MIKIIHNSTLDVTLNLNERQLQIITFCVLITTIYLTELSWAYSPIRLPLYIAQSHPAYPNKVRKIDVDLDFGLIGVEVLANAVVK